MKVKICGITNGEDAEEAVGLGAWAIGMIHYADSPRYCEPSDAAEIGASFRRQSAAAGASNDPALDEGTDATEHHAQSAIHLSGEEGTQFCTEVQRRTGLKVIKAIHVASAAEIHAAEVYRTDYHLFDKGGDGTWGGTGTTFDWNLLKDHHSGVPSILAGGLNPDNVTEAIAVTRPDAVDVASGVESEPGYKDHFAMARFFEAARYTPVAAE